MYYTLLGQIGQNPIVYPIVAKYFLQRDYLITQYRTDEGETGHIIRKCIDFMFFS